MVIIIMGVEGGVGSDDDAAEVGAAEDCAAGEDAAGEVAADDGAAEDGAAVDAGAGDGAAEDAGDGAAVVGAAVVGEAVVVFVVGKSMRESHSSFVLQMVAASISASVALLPVKAKQRKFRKCV